jgi:hypothetical protein
MAEERIGTYLRQQQREIDEKQDAASAALHKALG